LAVFWSISELSVLATCLLRPTFYNRPVKLQKA
jgi:hypothetical protein